MYEPSVTILMATYNGELFLREQLNSIIQQTHKNWHLIASDDESTDATVAIVKEHAATVYNGPSQGFAANFLSLIKQTLPESEYYAFADQDDVWHENKLTRALSWLETIPKSTPALYCGRTQLVDSSLSSLGLSPLYNNPPSFKNALVQSLAGGNTMVFNQAALDLLRQTDDDNLIVSHDWWTYLLVSGAGGQVFYDPKPHIFYRQHQANLIGSNSSLMARLKRIKMLFQGDFKRNIDLNSRCLLGVKHLLTDENKKVLQDFESARAAWFLLKIMKVDIYRQTRMGQFGLKVAAFFNKV